MSISADIQVHRAEDVVVTDTRASGSDNITTWTITFSLKRNPGDAAALITKTVGSGITITDGAGGVFTISLSSSDLTLTPGVYYWQAQRTNAGNQAVLTRGRFEILANALI